MHNVTLHTHSPPPPIQHIGEGGHWKGWALKLMYIKTHNIHNRIQNTEHRTEYRTRTQNTETHVHKITNVPVFIWCLDLRILMLANPLLRPIEGGALKI